MPARIDGPVKLTKGGATLSLSLRGSQAQAKVAGATATYAGVSPGVTAKLTSNNEAIKEDLILASAEAQSSFVYDLDLSDGLRPVSRKDGGLDIVDADGDLKFTAAAPVAADAKGDVAPPTATSMTVARDGKGWKLSLTLEKVWLQAPGRAFPVVLDPSFSVGTTGQCSIRQAAPTTGFCTSGELHVGRTAAGQATKSMLTFLNLDSLIPQGSNIVEGRVILSPLYQTSPGAAKNLMAQEMTNHWNQATWNNRTTGTPWATPGGEIASAVEATQPLPATGAKSYFRVTDLVSKWVAKPAENKGVAITDNGSTVNNTQVYASSSWSDSTKWPVLEIKYWPRTGAQPNSTIDSQQLTDRQSLGVNVASGNLLLTSKELQVPGTGLALDVTRYYNSGEDWVGQPGQRMRFSLGNDIVLYTCDDIGSRCLVGPSGYRVRFEKNADGTYKTPAGIGNMTLTQLTTGALNFELKDNGSGTVMEFFSNSFSFMNRMRDKNGNRIAFQSTGPNGSLSKIIDTHDREYPVTANSSGNTTKIEVPSSLVAGGQAWQYGYNAYQFMTSATDPEGKVTQYAYGSNNRINKITDPRGNETLVTYDVANRVTSVTRKVDGTTANDVTTTYTYPAVNDDCKGENNVISPDIVGRTVITDPNGHTAKYCWNKDGVVLVARDGLDRLTSTKYSPAGNVESFSALGGTSSPYATTAYTYGSGSGTGANPTKVVSPAGEQSDIGYLASLTGDLFKDAQPEQVKDDQGNLTKYTYENPSDRLNVSKIESERGTNKSLSAELTWDPLNKSRLKSSKDKRGNITQYGYTNGNLTSVAAAAAGIGTSQYTYDGISRVTQSSDGRGPGQWVQYTYDKLGRQLTTPDSDGLTQTVTYDDNGNVTTRSVPSASQYSSYTYDKLNRKTSETLHGVTTTYTYDKLGNLKTLTDASGTASYTYDNADRIETITAPTATTGTDVTTYGYVDPPSAAGNGTITASLPGGAGKIKQSIDTSGKLKEVLVTGSGAQTLKQTFNYNTPMANAAGGEQSQLVATALQNGGTGATVIGREYTYTDGAQVATVKALSGGTAIDTIALTYDESGNRKTRIKTPVTGSPTTTTYAYNANNQLCWQAVAAVATPACGTVPSGATTYTYDAAGNQVTGGFAASWDAKGRIDGYNGIYSKILSPNNNELIGLGSGNTFTNTQLGVQRIEMGGNLTKLVRDPGGVAVSQVRDSAKRWFVTDQLGSTIGLVEANGNVARTYAYDIDGNATTGGTGPETWIKYAGGHDVGGGLYHFGARYYQPSSARWTQMDPLLQPGDIGQANRYAYVGGDPINQTDPSGLRPGIGEGLADVTGARSCYMAVRGPIRNFYAQGQNIARAATGGRTAKPKSAGFGSIWDWGSCAGMAFGGGYASRFLSRFW